jgi:hypothetical protein
MESGEYFEKANIYRANNGSSSFQKIKQQQRKVKSILVFKVRRR